MNFMATMYSALVLLSLFVQPCVVLCNGNEGTTEATPTKRVLLDYFYNNEWKNGVRFHYIWEDTTNSGFSVLANIVKKVGAEIDTICEAPTRARLNEASIYLIVDPDTPKETDLPHYIEEPAIATIMNWVHSGGVLVLMGNDKGNAEFVHLNMLAEKFGIHFNEDSRNRVVGQDFGPGTFDKFPEHPLFKNVRKIYLKEISTLALKKPAKSIFTEGGDVIMAFSRIGKGAVFAVGDPWFYNEYMGTWRLSEGYDNARAAENLIRWLLSVPGSKH
jgi:hypothetical protein